MVANAFAFRPNRSIKNIDPQTTGQELERIRSERGQLTPEDVVEAASDDDSPLHPAFEWDDSSAAHQHRLAQARRLIVSVRVVNSPAQSRVPAFVSVRTPDRGRTYMPTVEALTDEQIRVRVLLEVRTFIESLERRYAHFAEAAEILSRLKQQAG
jgi:hypothetical protein